ncbi:MAG: hypothetical protein HC945_03315 [Nitrosarchaeum sp.]|nr:hypothetical protein [Nitrosarchaeum sp.]
MPKAFNIINATFGIVIGIGVAIYGVSLLTQNTGEGITWTGTGIVAVAYGIYQYKRYKSS